MTDKHDNMPNSGGDVERAVYEAMRLAGWIFPKAPQDVLRAEKAMADQPVELPEGLADPYAVLSRRSKIIRIGGRLQAPRDAAAEQHLAQAAREGGEIPPEVKEQMRKDRNVAEREKKSNE